jgi:hypothetical protein
MIDCSISLVAATPGRYAAANQIHGLFAVMDSWFRLALALDRGTSFSTQVGYTEPGFAGDDLDGEWKVKYQKRYYM